MEVTKVRRDEKTDAQKFGSESAVMLCLDCANEVSVCDSVCAYIHMYIQSGAKDGNMYTYVHKYIHTYILYIYTVYKP
jgi:hypothetical protein